MTFNAKLMCFGAFISKNEVFVFLEFAGRGLLPSKAATA